jgi:tetratricopeptide (TPR) repeat protein
MSLQSSQLPTQLRQDTAQILREISLIKSQLPAKEVERDSYILERFLDNISMAADLASEKEYRAENQGATFPIHHAIENHGDTQDNTLVTNTSQPYAMDFENVFEPKSTTMHTTSHNQYTIGDRIVQRPAHSNPAYQQDTLSNATDSSHSRNQSLNFETFKEKLTRFLIKVEDLLEPQTKSQKYSSPGDRMDLRVTPYFVGREHELGLLQQWLPSLYPSPNVVLLCGPDGIGKTQLALKFAQVNSIAYDHIFVVNSSSLEEFQNSLMELHATLDIKGKGWYTSENVLDWLIQNSHKRWLLILHNAARFELLQSFVSRLPGYGHIIITGIDSSLKDYPFVNKYLDIRGLNSTDSLLLLFARANLQPPQQNDIIKAQKLLANLENHPLAIYSAATYVKTQNLSVEEYVNIVHKDTSPKISSSHGFHDSLTNQHLIHVLELPFKEIDNELDAQLLLTLLVFFDTHGVTHEILKRGSSEQLQWNLNGELVNDKVSERFISADLIALLNQEDRFRKATELLVNLSVLNVYQSAEGSVFGMHLLHQELARARMGPAQRRKNLVQALFFLAQAFPYYAEILYERSSSPLERSCLAHVYAMYECFNKDLMGLTITYMNSLSNPSECLSPREQIAELVIKANTIQKGFDRSSSVKLLGWMNELLRESTNIYLKGRILESNWPIHRSDTTFAQANIPKFQEFLSYATPLIESGEVLLNELTNAQIGNIIARYAMLIYMEPTSDVGYSKGYELLEAWSPLDLDHPSTKERATMSHRCRVLGKFFKDHGQWQKSELEFHRYLNIYALPDSHEEGWSAGDLAQALLEMSRPVDAERIVVKYLAIRYPNTSPGYIGDKRRNDITYLEMLVGECFLEQKKYSQAEDIMIKFKRKLESFEPLASYERFRYFFVLTGLARCYHSTAKFEAALEYWSLALKYCTDRMNSGKREGKWTRDTLFVGIIVLSMSDCCHELGRIEASTELQQEAQGVLESKPVTYWVPGLASYWLQQIQRKVSIRRN